MSQLASSIWTSPSFSFCQWSLDFVFSHPRLSMSCRRLTCRICPVCRMCRIEQVSNSIATWLYTHYRHCMDDCSCARRRRIGSFGCAKARGLRCRSWCFHSCRKCWYPSFYFLNDLVVLCCSCFESWLNRHDTICSRQFCILAIFVMMCVGCVFGVSKS